MKKVCSKCKAFVEGEHCSICKGNHFSENWKGRIAILDAEKSEIAQHIGIKLKGEYAIRVR